MFSVIHNPNPSELKSLNKKRKVYFRQCHGSKFKTGDPRYIRVYDNGGETADRYTVVFTREINSDPESGRRGSYMLVGMSEAPFWPQGVCLHSKYSYRVDVPSYRHLGKRIGFSDLPSDCQKATLRDYIYLYDLVKGEA